MSKQTKPRLEENPLHSIEKRSRAHLSPESPENFRRKSKINKMDNQQPVGNIPMNELLGAFRDMLKEEMVDVSMKLQGIGEELQTLKQENTELKRTISELKKHQEEDRKKIEILDQISRRNKLIFRNLPKNERPTEEVQKLCKDTLNISGGVNINYVRKLNEKGESMTVLVELADQNCISKVLQSTKLLKGTRIGVERDLTRNAQDKRLAMSHLKNQILQEDKSKLIALRGENLKIENKVFYWKSEIFTCGNQNGITELEKLYNKKFVNVNFNFRYLLQAVKSKDENKTKSIA